jgi:hypothetical protein
MGVPSFGDAADLLGVNVRHLARWKGRGITIDQADALACRAGLHPGEVWPEWWDARGRP